MGLKIYNLCFMSLVEVAFSTFIRELIFKEFVFLGKCWTN